MSKFEQAVKIVNGLPKDGKLQPTNDEKLYFYSRYKQSSEGKCTTQKPGMLDFVGKAKWNAWNDLGEKPKEEAEQEYVAKLEEMLKRDDSDESKGHLKTLEETA